MPKAKKEKATSSIEQKLKSLIGFISESRDEFNALKFTINKRVKILI